MTHLTSADRQTQRYNYAYIALKYKKNLYWSWVKATNWSKGGFCFFSDSEFEVGAKVHFKKAKHEFAGLVRWKQIEPDHHTLLNMALNKLIVDEVYHKDQKKDWEDAILKQLRSADLDVKIDFVQDELEIQLTKEKFEEMVQQNSWANAICYGVHCEDESWKDFVSSEVERTDNPKELGDQVKKWIKFFE